MNKPLIFGIGEIVWDCLPEGKKLGGAPVNFAYYAGKLGADVKEAHAKAVALAAKVCTMQGAIAL